MLIINIYTWEWKRGKGRFNPRRTLLEQKSMKKITLKIVLYIDKGKNVKNFNTIIICNTKWPSSEIISCNQIWIAYEEKYSFFIR